MLFSTPQPSEPLSTELHPAEKPLPSLNSSSPIKTQPFLATLATPAPHKELCPPLIHRGTLLGEHQDTEVCVCPIPAGLLSEVSLTEPTPMPYPILTAEHQW